mmetsp:Transcript_90141/g.226921  ORF Transcript_90141/g.226921 Transcript_90141/m.226921 type:complete len:271 (-) Transcript_90141:1168-1980(-)
MRRLPHWRCCRHQHAHTATRCEAAVSSHSLHAHRSRRARAHRCSTPPTICPVTRKAPSQAVLAMPPSLQLLCWLHCQMLQQVLVHQQGLSRRHAELRTLSMPHRLHVQQPGAPASAPMDLAVLLGQQERPADQPELLHLPHLRLNCCARDKTSRTVLCLTPELVMGPQGPLELQGNRDHPCMWRPRHMGQLGPCAPARILPAAPAPLGRKARRGRGRQVLARPSGHPAPLAAMVPRRVKYHQQMNQQGHPPGRNLSSAKPKLLAQRHPHV